MIDEDKLATKISLENFCLAAGVLNFLYLMRAHALLNYSFRPWYYSSWLNTNQYFVSRNDSQPVWLIPVHTQKLNPHDL